MRIATQNIGIAPLAVPQGLHCRGMYCMVMYYGTPSLAGVLLIVGTCGKV